jgi:hypothetical protein
MIKSVLWFVAGVAAGSVATWFIARKIHQDEMAQVETDELDPIDDIDEDDDYRPLTEDDFIVDLRTEGEKEMDAEMTRTEPYLIAPEEFATRDDYDIVTLTYYADEVLTDEFDEVIYDIDGTVGEESLKHFGDYPDDPDTVYVRNEELMTDYEILLDEREYASVSKWP